MTESLIKLPEKELKLAPQAFAKCLACAAEDKYGGILLQHICEKKDYKMREVNPGVKNDYMLRILVDYCNRNPDHELNVAFIEISKYPFIYGSLRALNTKDKDWLEDIAYPTKMNQD